MFLYRKASDSTYFRCNVYYMVTPRKMFINSHSQVCDIGYLLNDSVLYSISRENRVFTIGYSDIFTFSRVESYLHVLCVLLLLSLLLLLLLLIIIFYSIGIYNISSSKM